MKLRRPHIMPDHIRHASGKSKTVCVTACLTALGIPFDGFQVTGTLCKPNYMATLNRFGLSARSRMSKMPRAKTIGQCRQAIAKLQDPAGTVYLVVLWSPSYCHAILVNSQGETVVDTAPRKADRRKIHAIHAIT